MIQNNSYKIQALIGETLATYSLARVPVVGDVLNFEGDPHEVSFVYLLDLSRVGDNAPDACVTLKRKQTN